MPPPPKAKGKGKVVPPPQVAPRAQGPSHGGLRSTEHWRADAGRYGDRGGRGNPNVAWHTGKARAQNRGPAFLAKFLADHPKPPKKS